MSQMLALATVTLLLVSRVALASSGSFAIGNSLITRSFVQEDHQAFTSSFKARTKIKVWSKEFDLIFMSDGRTVVVNRLNSTLESTSVSPSDSDAVLRWMSKAPEIEIDVHYHTDRNQPYIFKWLEVTNRSKSRVSIERASVEALKVGRGTEPWRGGVGQPVFLQNEFFLGIEHPAAANEVLGQNIILSEYPEVDIAPGGSWKSARSVLGVTTGNEQTVADAFRKYLVAVTGRHPVYRPIYIDWAAHDELGTLVKPQLTEQLTDSMLNTLQSMKSRDDIQFDYYVLDAFWFAPTGAYIRFKKPNWPNGFGPAERRILALGMKPGLWFDLSCAPHRGPLHNEFIDLKDTPGWHGPAAPCLSDPQFSRFLEDAMGFQIREHSLGLLKFDFANMLCHHDDPEASSLAILEKNARALLGVVGKVRQLNPAMVIRAYNGFSSSRMMTSTKYYDQGYSVSPWWLSWFDSVYSGDPRPADLPSYTDLRDSIIWYQDHVVRGYMRSLMPPFAIDDSGTLVGKTSTIYYIGAQGFTDSWIMNIMRGNLAPELYGDLRLLTENDRKFVAATLHLLQTHEEVLVKTRPILGMPGRGQVYGYLADGKNLAFVTVVNPGLYPQSFLVATPPSLPPASLKKLLFSNDGEHHEPVQPVRGELSGTLIPGEIRVYALGTEGRIASLWLPPAPTRRYHHVTPFRDPFAAGRNANIRITPSDLGRTLAFVIQYRKNGQPDRSYIWPENVMKVSGNIGSHSVTFSSVPAAGTDIWSKCSWAVFKHEVAPEERNRTLRLTLIGNPPAGTQWRIHALWLR